VLKVSRPALSSLLNGKADLSRQMALRVEKAFGVKMETRMQSAYDIACTHSGEEHPGPPLRTAAFRVTSAARAAAQPDFHLAMNDLGLFLKPLPDQVGAPLGVALLFFLGHSKEHQRKHNSSHSGAT
jgi:hypothetical protein